MNETALTSICVYVLGRRGAIRMPEELLDPTIRISLSVGVVAGLMTLLAIK
jgi:hypothetical protein